MNASIDALKLPDEHEIEQAKESSRTLAKYVNADRVQLSIKGSNSASDEFVLPGIVMQMLLDILSETSKGNAISVIPYHAELSTQEAANILNVSRPYLVKLLENGKIPFHKAGSHRRVLAENVIKYKRDIDSARVQSLKELSELSQEYDMEY